MTDRGQPVAELAPIANRETAANARLGELERKGWLRRGDKSVTREIPKRVRSRIAHPGVVDLLVGERAGGW